MWAENCIAKFVAGHAYARAVRAHIFTHLALLKIIMDCMEFSDEECEEIDDFMDVLDRPAVLTTDSNDLVKEEIYLTL